MQKTVIAAALALVGTFAPALTHSETPPPQTPNTAVAATSTAELPAAPAPARSREDASPVRVIIPAIGLNAPIQNMGVLQNGELAVPGGSTDNVGWYADGTVPGEVGSAVFDAHVFAAFSDLKDVRPGDDIYVVDADGTNVHFKAQDAETYALSALTPDMLFSRADQPRLNLITCAGQLTPDRSTYDHRLVVYAVLAN